MRLRRIIPLSFIVILVLQVVILPFQVSALKDSFFYNSNSIMFYDPDAVDCASAQTLGEGLTIEKTDTTDAIYSFLTKTKLSSNGDKALSPAQAAGVMGNMYAESGFNPSAIEVTDREEKGHGLVQWTFGRWDNLEAFAEEQGKPWDDLDTQLKFLEKELEGSEKAIFDDSLFTEAEEPAIAAMRFRIIFERADPTVAHDDRREGAAIWAFKEYANGSASAECIAGNGIVAGNLVETAINFALDKPADEGMNTKAHARSTYRVAKERYNPTVHWTDCGGFIATVMYATGVDKSFPNVNTDTQSAYVRSNPDKYLIIESFELTDLLPGDLLYTNGHVTMYTGMAQYPSVDASYYNPTTEEGGRVPSVRNSSSAQWMKDNGAFIARILK